MATKNKRVTRRSSLGRSNLRRLAWRYVFRKVEKLRIVVLLSFLLGISSAIAIEKADYPEPNYSLLNTSLQGLPVVLLVNSALVDFTSKEDFPWHLSIIIDIQELAEKGMPTQPESLLVTELAEQLENEITKTKNAVFFVRQTWNGKKQLIFRVSNPKEADKTLKSLLLTHNVREWEYQMERDNEWFFAEVYFNVLATAK
jgi:hypothetical protein